MEENTIYNIDNELNENESNTEIKNEEQPKKKKKAKDPTMMTLCTKLSLKPVGDKDEINRVYKYIRDGQYAQYRTMNILMSEYVSAYYKTHPPISEELTKAPLDETDEEKKIREAMLKEIYKEQNDAFAELKKEFARADNPMFSDIVYPTGCDTKAMAMQKVYNDFNTALSNGLARGERSANNYKKTNPLMAKNRFLRFYHNYETDEEFYEKLFTKEAEVFIHWVNKIDFKVKLGTDVNKTMSLRSKIKDIFEGKVVIGDSSIMIKDKDIILNLALNTKKEVKELDENIVVGVDLGIAVPAFVSLNIKGKEYIRKPIGNGKRLQGLRTQIKEQRKRLGIDIAFNNGGHGRKKKLKPYIRYKAREKNFAKTYQHKVSSEIVKFALKNKAKYINIEDLSDNNFEDKLLSIWGYYQLQQFITYKAEKVGIIVRKINPNFTSQVCSSCGNWDINNRINQAEFKCQYCGNEINADRNASINIARSTLFTTKTSKKKDKNALFLEAMRYYDIDEDKYCKQKGISKDELGNIGSDKNKKKKSTKKTNKKVA